MGLEWNGLTIASHLLLIAVLGRLVVRLANAPLDRAVRAYRCELFPGLSLAFGMLALERVYYVVARVLDRGGIDLWAAHPTPEVLSVMVAIAIFLAQAPFVLAQSHSLTGALRRIGAEAAVLLLGWAVIGWSLW